MSTEASGATAPTTDNSSVDDLPRDATQIGVDTEGLVVYYSKTATAVYVANNNEVVYTRDDIEPGQPLVRYMDHISRARGWESTNLFGSWPDAFKAKLEASDR